MKEKKICTICYGKDDVEHLYEFDGEWLCASCLSEKTVLCNHCGTRIWREDSQGDENIFLCYDCYENHYTTCSDCECVIHRGSVYYYDDEPFCRECYDKFSSNRTIHDYYYKPSPIFYGDGERYLGVELEVDSAGEYDESADTVMDIGNRDKWHIYCKHDGSLDDGFEIVTHPMTLDYHLNNMPWYELLNKLKSMGYLSHQANTCGLHVHVNRSSLGKTLPEQDATIARILYFVEKHWDELLKFSRRTNRQLDRWATRYGYKDKPKEILEHAKKGVSNGRYTCINLENNNTIEFRIFRGTLKYNTVIATLQMIDKICNVARYFSDEEIQNMSWTTFVSSCTDVELITYLKERRIYINEPVECEEEL